MAQAEVAPPEVDDEDVVDVVDAVDVADVVDAVDVLDEEGIQCGTSAYEVGVVKSPCVEASVPETQALDGVDVQNCMVPRHMAL